MGKHLFIPDDPPYGIERIYNGLHLANAATRREGAEVWVFLTGGAAARQAQIKGPGQFLQSGAGDEGRHYFHGLVGVCST